MASGGKRLRRDALANRERVLAAAVTAVLREGDQVPMATIAAEAGVGVGTLYRRYPTREALLGALTTRSFGIVLDCAQHSQTADLTGLAAVDCFLDAVVQARNQLILPLHGGPPDLPDDARRLQSEVHQVLGQLLDRGRADHTIGAGVTTADVVIFGAMLAVSLPHSGDWQVVADRQKTIFLAGLAPDESGRSSNS
jgi:AcrR family transcriptional regulator